MENRHHFNAWKGAFLIGLFAIGFVFAAFTRAMAADEKVEAQAIVDRARGVLNDFMHDSRFVWLHENLNQAKGVLIFPEVNQGGLLVGGAGGTGVFLARDGKGNWSEPAFYTTASVNFGLLAGFEKSELVLVAMTQKAVDSLLTSSFEMGGDITFALGPNGFGDKATVNMPNINADFIAFYKDRGAYGGLDLGGTDIHVDHDLNAAYYRAGVTPIDILVKRDVANKGAKNLMESLKKSV